MVLQPKKKQEADDTSQKQGTRDTAEEARIN